MGGLAQKPQNFNYIGPINCADLAAVIRLQTAFFDGRIINLRSLWVRIHGLPFLYLTREWDIQILSHVGCIKEFEFTGEGLPPSADMQVKMVVNLTQPLIPGCFVPVEGHTETQCKIEKECRKKKALARSLRLSGSRVHPLPRASVPPFLPYSPSTFGGGLPNLPLTEFDPPSSSVTPVVTINVDELFNLPIPLSAQSKKKHKEREGGFNFWKDNDNGSKDLVSKAITDEDMACIWSVQVDADILENVKKRRRSPSLESTCSSVVRPRRPSSSHSLLSATVGMDWEANQQLDHLLFA
uniref:DUF4283 domain-containing protein n=1 Tax=Chenopodium quinoa TaxID=63459 RepID=A0A803MV23_CHEQI